MKSSSEVAMTASLSAEFVFSNQDNKVNWGLWYSSTNDLAMDFLKNFRENQLVMSNEATFTPHIVTRACTACDAESKRKDCLSNGRYCAMNHKDKYIEGKDILMEDLRQFCLFKLVKADNKEDQWWQYIQYVHRMCYEEVNEQCSKLGHKEIGRDYNSTMKCVLDSFETQSS